MSPDQAVAAVEQSQNMVLEAPVAPRERLRVGKRLLAKNTLRLTPQGLNTRRRARAREQRRTHQHRPATFNPSAASVR